MYCMPYTWWVSSSLAKRETRASYVPFGRVRRHRSSAGALAGLRGRRLYFLRRRVHHGERTIRVDHSRLSRPPPGKQPINQSINQSINHSTSQSSKQASNEPTNQPTNRIDQPSHIALTHPISASTEGERFILAPVSLQLQRSAVFFFCRHDTSKKTRSKAQGNT